MLALVRVLTALFALHFCGLIHEVSDVVSAVTVGQTHEHEQCPPDRPCEDCPPGCPNCHCGTLGSFALAPRVSGLLGHVSSAQASLFENAEAPPGPELPSLFRPPRG